MKHEPYIFIGTGRSGTSIMAGILRKLGIFMGYTFVPANNSNLSGHWEDIEFIGLIQYFLGVKGTEEQWYEQLIPLLRRRYAMEIPWGWKAPITTNVLQYITGFCPDGKYIWSRRQADEVVKSMYRCYSMPEAVARDLYDGRENAIKKYKPKNVHEIWLEDIKTNPEQVIKQFLRWSGHVASPQQINEALTLVERKPNGKGKGQQYQRKPGSGDAERRYPDLQAAQG